MSSEPIYNDCRVFGHFKRIERPIAFSAFPVETFNHICDILEHLSGVNCRIEKQSKENPNWLIVVDQPETDSGGCLFRVRKFGTDVGIFLPKNSATEGSWVRFNGLNTTATGLPANSISDSLPDWRKLTLRGLVKVRVTLPNRLNGTASWTLAQGLPIAADDATDQTTSVDVPIAEVNEDGNGKISIIQFHLGLVFLTHFEFTKCEDDSSGSSSSSS